MSALCVSPIKALVMRLVKLDACGAPITGESSAVVVADGFIQINPSPQYEDGVEFLQKKANGSFCVNELDPPELKRVELEIQWCVLDPDALVIQTGERLLTTGTPATGTGVAYGEGLITARYSLEVWQPVSGANACTPGGSQQYVYWAFPNVGNTRVNDWTFENGVFTYTTMSTTSRASVLWGDGPGSAGPWIESPIEEGEHFLHNVTTTAPPVSSCGAVLLT